MHKYITHRANNRSKLINPVSEINAPFCLNTGGIAPIYRRTKLRRKSADFLSVQKYRSSVRPSIVMTCAVMRLPTSRPIQNDRPTPCAFPSPMCQSAVMPFLATTISPTFFDLLPSVPISRRSHTLRALRGSSLVARTSYNVGRRKERLSIAYGVLRSSSASNPSSRATLIVRTMS